MNWAMGKVVMFFLFVLLATMVSAQNILNVDFHQEGDKIVITYDLDESSDVWLYVSLNGGKTYNRERCVHGDVGRVVLPGKKQIVWNVLYDFPEGLVGQVQFKVSTNLFVSIDGVEFEMVYVKGGTFQIKEGLNPVHTETLSDYYIGKYEVTQGLWKKVMGTTIEQQPQWDEEAESSYYPYVEATYPMFFVDWPEASKFCKMLTMHSMGELMFQLPTEAQWEYAARGGVKSKGYKYSGSNNINEVAWYGKNYGLHPVGMKRSNELGVYDMSGNVAELCRDDFKIVLRGGSCANDASNCCVSSRSNYDKNSFTNAVGFRLVGFIVKDDKMCE